MTREEAIRRIKAWNLETDDREVLATIIPELVESEDEKIRSAMIRGFNSMMANQPVETFAGESIRDILAWLEKQKEQKPDVKDPFDDEQFWRGYEAGKNDAMRMSEMVLYRQSWYMEGYRDREFGRESKWLIKTGEGGSRYEENPRYGQPLAEEQKTAEIDEYKIIKKHITEDALSSEVNKRLKECGWYVTDEKPAEWSEEDEDTYNRVYYLFRDAIDEWYKAIFSGCYPKITKDKVLAMLKSLRHQPQPKQEWSEADEKDIYSASCWLCEYAGFILSDNKEKASILYALANRLKSLRPSWKPSEGHLSALLAILNDPNNIWSQTCQLALSDLYEQLKRLKKYEDNANEDNT